MQSEIISLKHKLDQKEEALAEIVDEIVYFENNYLVIYRHTHIFVLTGVFRAP